MIHPVAVPLIATRSGVVHRAWGSRGYVPWCCPTAATTGRWYWGDLATMTCRRCARF